MSGADGYSHCKACGAAIRFVHTKNGKRMPIDVEPKAIGVSIREGLLGPVVDSLRTAVHTTHWETCSHAKEFRGGKS